MPEERDLTIYKHRGAIEIMPDTTPTRTQRLLWNYLFLRAFPDLAAKELHIVRIAEINTELYNGQLTNLKLLKEQLMALGKQIVRWNIMDEQGRKEWGFSGYLASAQITEDNEVKYSYSAALRHYLAYPDIYARIQLSIEKRLNSKYSLALYEIAAAYYILSRKRGVTQWYDVDTLRNLLGCGNEQAYKTYRALSQLVLTPAIAEIEKKTDLRLEIEKQTRGRKITHIRFQIYAAPGQMLKTNDIAKPAPVDTTELKARLVEQYGLTDAQATTLTTQYAPGHILERLAYVDARRATIKNLPAYTYAAVSFVPPEASEVSQQGQAQAPAAVKLPPAGTKIEVMGQEYVIDESGAAENSRGVIPPGQLRQLLKSGIVEILG